MQKNTGSALLNSEKLKHGQRKNPLNVGADPDHSFIFQDKALASKCPSSLKILTITLRYVWDTKSV